MKRLLWFGMALTALLTAILAAPEASASEDPVRLETGQSALINAAPVERVAVASGDIAEVEVIEETGEILIFGRNPGRTDLRVWRNGGQRALYPIVVTAAAGNTRTASVRHIVAMIDGVALTEVEGEFILSGTPASPDDANQLQRLTATYPDVRNFTNRRAEPVAATVRLQARFVELSKSTLSQIGVDWSSRSPGVTFAWASDLTTNDVFRGNLGDFLPNDQLPLDIGQANGYFGVGLNLSAMIDLLGESGEARVIAEPMLSTLSGSSARFQAGGELPVPVQGEDGNTTVTFRDYGILLEVEPVITADERIRTRVDVEVSDIDESVSVLGIPGFSVRNASTEMSAQSGQTLLIAGLIDGEESEAVSSVPGLGDLPVLGELFRSRRFQRDETELVVLITPYLGDARPREDGALALKQRPTQAVDPVKASPAMPSAGHLHTPSRRLPLELPPK